MYKNNKILCIIPARSGSKGLPGKNIKKLLGKPLLAHTIQQAKGSRYIDRIIVSTDNKNIAAISGRYGAQTPFLRPKSLATDTAKSADVVLHAINWLNKKGSYTDIAILLQPTSPLRLTEDIDKAIKLLFKKNAQAVVSVCEAEHSPYWMNTLPADGCMKNFLRPYAVNKNRQNLPICYRLNGAIYIGYNDYLFKQKNFFGKETFAYIMPKQRSVDIDDEFDFWLAEQILSKQTKHRRQR